MHIDMFNMELGDGRELQMGFQINLSNLSFYKYYQLSDIGVWLVLDANPVHQSMEYIFSKITLYPISKLFSLVNCGNFGTYDGTIVIIGYALSVYNCNDYYFLFCCLFYCLFWCCLTLTFF